MPKHVTITNYDKGSQLLIPTSEWTDSGIYTITVKNIVGQDSVNIEVKVTGNCPSPHTEFWDTLHYFCTFSTSISITVTLNLTADDPKPPGPVKLDQNILGTVTISWASSPDERRDDRLHYLVKKRDSSKRTWKIVADNLFNNKFTLVNVLPGTEYHFRVFAKNDVGLSPPSDSPAFEIKKEKGL